MKNVKYFSVKKSTMRGTSDIGSQYVVQHDPNTQLEENYLVMISGERKIRCISWIRFKYDFVFFFVCSLDLIFQVVSQRQETQ